MPSPPATVDKIQVLVWNYHDDLVTAPASPVHLSVKVPAEFGTSAVVTRTLADETHGDAYTVWASQGKPATPSATQIQQLKEGMQPVLLEPARTVDVVAGTVNLDFDLARFGVLLVTLAPVEPIDASVEDALGGVEAGVGVAEAARCLITARGAR